jgi:adhesin HecA-like repeat protein
MQELELTIKSQQRQIDNQQGKIESRQQEIIALAGINNSSFAMSQIKR